MCTYNLRWDIFLALWKCMMIRWPNSYATNLRLVFYLHHCSNSNGSKSYPMTRGTMVILPPISLWDHLQIISRRKNTWLPLTLVSPLFKTMRPSLHNYRGILFCGVSHICMFWNLQEMQCFKCKRAFSNQVELGYCGHTLKKMYVTNVYGTFFSHANTATSASLLKENQEINLIVWSGLIWYLKAS